MTAKDISGLKNRLFFTSKDVSQARGIQLYSAQVLCSRYVKRGLFVRIKKDFYVLSDKFDYLSKESLFKLANFIQVPSYVSFMTALAYYDITTQVQRGYFENASLKRTVSYEANGTLFTYSKLKLKYYSDYEKKDNFFIASKEKAFIDVIYLYSFGKYKFDVASLNIAKLDKQRVKRILKTYPYKTRSIACKICGI